MEALQPASLRSPGSGSAGRAAIRWLGACRHPVRGEDGREAGEAFGGMREAGFEGPADAFVVSIDRRTVSYQRKIRG